MSYQEVIKKGSFPTISWFEHFPRTKGDVIDVGCSDGTMCAMYKRIGATKVTGVDVDISSAQDNYGDEDLNFVETKAEDFTPESYDVAVFSMIVHWLSNPGKVMKKIGDVTRQYMVFIFRTPNPAYKIPDNGTFFPTPGQLSVAMANLGFRLYKYKPGLLVQDENKTIDLAIFQRVKVFKKGDVYNKEWRRKIKKLGIEVEHINNVGYVQKYFDGVDLQEDRPFGRRHDQVRSLKLNDQQKKSVKELFKDTVKKGIDTGMLLADFTKRNIIMTGPNANLIDFDVIINVKPDVPIPNSYIQIFQEMLDYLEINYKFDGVLETLYENIC